MLRITCRCYPSRAGYEAGDGGEGIAWSDDGVQWHRESQTVGVLSGGRSKAAAPWESHVVYQPNLVCAVHLAVSPHAFEKYSYRGAARQAR